MKLLILTDSKNASVKSAMLAEAIEAISKANGWQHASSAAEPFDIILTCSPTRLAEALSLKRFHKAPVVGCFYKSELTRLYGSDFSEIDFSYILRDVDIRIMFPFFYSSEEIAVPWAVRPESRQEAGVATSRHARRKLLVCIHEIFHSNCTVLKFFQQLNKLTQADITIDSDAPNLQLAANPHIRIEPLGPRLEQTVAESDAVVGSGAAIVFAIRHNVPFAIVGERGYGGIPDNTNFQLHYRSFFQGRLGGKFDDPVPARLLDEDIRAMLEASADHAQFRAYAHNEIMALASGMARRFDALAGFYDDFKRNSIDAQQLAFNPDMTIVKGKGAYWLLNRFTRQIICSLDEAYASLAVGFAQGKPPRLSEENRHIIAELIENRILMFSA